MGAHSFDLPTGLTPGGRFAEWRPQTPAYVVCDIDGTLVGPSHLASTEVADAVARAKAAGLHVGVATGRMRGGVAKLNEQLNAPGPHVTFNGGEVRSSDGVIASWSLSAEQVDGLIAIARAGDDRYVEIYTDEGFWIAPYDERGRPHWQILDAEPDGEITSAAQLDGAPVLKATFAAFADGVVDQLVHDVAALGLLPGAAGSPRTPELDYVNATHPDADKGRAILRAADYLDIGIEQVVAVGDAPNDLSMLGVAGTAIAMGQAPDSIRAAAHLVAPSVDAHGVATVIDAVLGWRESASSDSHSAGAPATS